MQPIDRRLDAPPCCARNTDQCTLLVLNAGCGGGGGDCCCSARPAVQQRVCWIALGCTCTLSCPCLDRLPAGSAQSARLLDRAWALYTGMHALPPATQLLPVLSIACAATLGTVAASSRRAAASPGLETGMTLLADLHRQGLSQS